MAATIKIVVESSGGLGPVQKDIEGLGASAQGAGGGFTVMKGLAVNALTAVASAAVSAAQGVASFVGDSITAAGNFEASVNGLAAVTGSALEDAGFSFDDVKDKALQLGMDTQFSAQQAIEAMTELAKGGVPVADVMDKATDATLALASAAGLDLAPAAEIVAKQLGVWSEQGVTAQEVADTLASAANASTVSVEELALGLANVGGTAKTAGLSFQDVNQTLALIAPNFSSAADAGTSLKTFISRLIPTTDSAKDAMIALGLATEDGKSKFFDAQGSFIGMEQAAALLQSATAGLSEEEKLLAFNTIFGADAIRSAAAIANAGAPGFLAMGEAMDAAGGAAAASAAKNQGFSFAMEQMKGSIETLQIVIGSALLPILTDLVNQFTSGINIVLQFTQTILSAPDPIAALGAAIMSVIPQFTSSGEAVGGLSGLLQTFLTVAQNVMAGYQAIINAIMPIVASFIAAHGAEIQAFFQQAWDQIVVIIDLALQLYNAIVPPILQAIAGFISAHGAEITAYFNSAWQAISSLIDAALTLIRGILQAALQIIQGDWSGAWSTIQTMSARFVQDIIGVIQGAAGMFAAATQIVVDAIKGVWDGFVSKASAIGTSIINGIKDGITSAASSLASAAANAAKSALDAAKSALGISSPSKLFAMEVGKPMAEGMALGLAGNAPMVAGAAAATAGAAYAGAKSVSNSKTFNYSPTINNYGGGSGALDYSTARALGGV